MPGIKVRAVCTDGREVDRVIEEKHGDKKFLYGLWYDPATQKTKKCYVGPADPENVLRSMPAALLVEPEVWIPAVKDALLATAQNVLAYRPELAPELARALLDVARALGLPGLGEERPVEAVKAERCRCEGRKGREAGEEEALPA